MAEEDVKHVAEAAQGRVNHGTFKHFINGNILFPTSPNWYHPRALATTVFMGCPLFAFASSDWITVGIINTIHHSPSVKSLAASNVKSVVAFDEIRGHSDRVVAVDLQCVQERQLALYSASLDGTVRLWLAEFEETCCRFFQLKLHRMHQTAEIVSVVGCKQIEGCVSGDRNGTIVVWRCFDENKSTPQSFKPGASGVPVCDLEVCSEKGGTLLAIGYQNGSIVLFDLNSSGVVRHLNGHQLEIFSLSWSTFGLASSSKDDTIRVWDCDSGECSFEWKVARSKQSNRSDAEKRRTWISQCWSPVSKRIYFSNNSGEVYELDVAENLVRKVKGSLHGRLIFGLKAALVSPSLFFVISIGLDRNIGVWKFPDIKQSFAVPSIGGHVYNIEQNANGSVAIPSGDNCIRLFDLNSGDRKEQEGNLATPPRVRYLWKGIQGKVTSLSWHPNQVSYGHILSFGTDAGKAVVYDTRSERTLQTYDGTNKPDSKSSSSLKSLSWMISGPLEFLVSSCEDGNAFLHLVSWSKKSSRWNLADSIASLPLFLDQTLFVRNISCHPIDRYIAASVTIKSLNQHALVIGKLGEFDESTDISALTYSNILEFLQFVPLESQISSDPLVSMAWSSSDQLCCGSSSGRLWNVERLENKFTSTFIGTVTSSALSLRWNAHLIMVSCSGGDLFQIAPPQWQSELVGKHGSRALCCVVSSTGDILSGGEDQKVAYWLNMDQLKSFPSDLFVDESPEFQIPLELKSSKKSKRSQKKPKAADVTSSIGELEKYSQLTDDPHAEMKILNEYAKDVCEHDAVKTIELKCIESRHADLMKEQFIPFAQGLITRASSEIMCRLVRVSFAPASGYSFWESEMARFCSELNKSGQFRESAVVHLLLGETSAAVSQFLKGEAFEQAFLLVHERFSLDSIEGKALMSRVLIAWNHYAESKKLSTLAKRCLICCGLFHQDEVSTNMEAKKSI
jgi:WD40 repeat protein